MTVLQLLSSSLRSFSKLKLVLFLLALLLYVLSVVTLFSSSLRSAFVGWVKSDRRKILSVINSDLGQGGRLYRILKLSVKNGVSVEIYAVDESGVSQKLDSTFLKNHRDVYFHIMGQATNLALRDLDGDGRPEIIAPTYDKNYIAKLNPMRFNSEAARLEAFLQAE